MLQPIKNKFPGTELALKLISEAIDVLKDSGKVLEFNTRRHDCFLNYESLSLEALSDQSIPCQDKGPAHSDPVDSVKASMEMNDSIMARNVEVYAEEDKSMDVDVPSARVHPCVRPYEHQLRAFKAMAREMPDQDLHDFGNERKLDKIKQGEIWAVHYQLQEVHNYRYVRIVGNANSGVSVIWLRPVPASDGERWCKAGLPVSSGSFSLDLEMGEQVLPPELLSYNSSRASNQSCLLIDIYPKKGEVWALYEECRLNELLGNPEVSKNCKFKLVEFLSDFSKDVGAECACLEKVDGCRSIFRRQNQEGSCLNICRRSLYKLSHKVPAYKFKGGEAIGVVAGTLELDLLALPCSMIKDTDNKVIIIDEEEETTVGSDVTAGQVWAVYCSRDLMPRRYALVDNVISATEVRVRFLELEPTTDYEIDWRKEKLPVVCGMYRASGSSMDIRTSRLSHRVHAQTDEPLYKINPLKGEVWAVYRNWKRGWRQSDYETCQHWVFEIVSDFSEGGRMMVAKLGKVKGCTAFFQRQRIDGFDVIHEISRTEIPCFSHQIPAFQVPGIGTQGIPGSSWLLESSALPFHIL